MAEIAFVVRVKNHVQADLGSMLKQGLELVRIVRKDIPVADSGDVELLEVLKSDSHLVPDVFAALTTSNTPTSPLATRTGSKTVTEVVIAGAAAGAHTVTGIKTTDELGAVRKLAHTSVGIAGGAAGAHTVTGILTTDVLVSVVHVDDTTHVATDKTSEYTISGADTIDNTGGTASTGAHVVVTYHRQTDLTSEFTITAADTIDNTAGTTSAADELAVSYRRV